MNTNTPLHDLGNFINKKGTKTKIGFLLIFINIFITIYIIFNDSLLIPSRYHNEFSITIPSDGIIISRTLAVLFLLYLISQLAYYLIKIDK